VWRLKPLESLLAELKTAHSDSVAQAASR